MATSYHMEARIKQARMDRWNDQKKRAELGPQETERENVDNVTYKQKMDKVLTTDPGHFNTVRHPLPMFRVNEEGYSNRYQNRQHLAPHVDRAFAVMYPGSDNSEYTANDTLVNRRQNRAMDKYEISIKVNGEFHMQLAHGSESDTDPVEQCDD